MTSPEIDRLANLAREAAREHPDWIGLVTSAIKSGASSDADPYLLVGVLIEGIVQTLADRIPAECRPETVQAVAHMLGDRLAACHLL